MSYKYISPEAIAASRSALEAHNASLTLDLCAWEQLGNDLAAARIRERIRANERAISELSRFSFQQAQEACHA